MNEPTTQPYTLELIAQLKRRKRDELRESGTRIREMGQELFAPQESSNRMEHAMNYINAGISAYDGILTGLKIFRRIRRFFASKKNTNAK